METGEGNGFFQHLICARNDSQILQRDQKRDMLWLTIKYLLPGRPIHRFDIGDLLIAINNAGMTAVKSNDP